MRGYRDHSSDYIGTSVGIHTLIRYEAPASLVLVPGSGSVSGGVIARAAGLQKRDTEVGLNYSSLKG